MSKETEPIQELPLSPQEKLELAEIGLTKLHTQMVHSPTITEEMAYKIALLHIDLEREIVCTNLKLNAHNTNTLKRIEWEMKQENYSHLLVDAISGEYANVKRHTEILARKTRHKGQEIKNDFLKEQYIRLADCFQHVTNLMPEKGTPLSCDGMTVEFLDENLEEIFGNGTTQQPTSE